MDGEGKDNQGAAKPLGVGEATDPKATRDASSHPASANAGAIPETRLAGAEDGRQIGPYRLVREIASGGMGAVYLARIDGETPGLAAVKLIRKELASPDFVRRFKQERQLLAALDHPHVARVLDFGETPDGQIYYAMEYVDGTPIDEHCRSANPDHVTRIRLFRQLCDAVGFLHDNHVIHRDLKPGNILISSDGTVKLIDFGIAKVRDFAVEAGLETGPAKPTMIMTPAYASPEQLTGETVTATSDVYSLAKILYEMLEAGAPPRTAGTPLPLNDELRAILTKAARKEPSERYASAKELGADIDHYLSNFGQPVTSGPPPTRPAPPPTAPPPAANSRTGKLAAIAAAVAVVVLALAGVGGWMAYRAFSSPDSAVLSEAAITQRISDLRQRLGAWPDPPVGASRTLSREEKLADLASFTSLFGAALPRLFEREPGATEARRAMVADGSAYLDRAYQYAGDDTELQQQIALAYRVLGDMQGRPAQQNIADQPGASTSYRRSQQILNYLVSSNPSNSSLTNELLVTEGRIRELDPRVVVVAPAPGLLPEEPQAPGYANPTPVQLPGKRLDGPGFATDPGEPPQPPPGGGTRTASPPPIGQGNTAGASAPDRPAPEPPVAPPNVQPEPEQVQQAVRSPEEQAQWDDLEDRYSLAAAHVDTARSLLEDHSARLAAMGQSPRSDLLSGVTNGQLNLERARHEIEQGNLERARELVKRADAFASRVLKQLGG